MMRSEKVRSYWNEYFSENSSDWLLKYEDVRDLILQYLEPNSRILVLGCGQGSMAPGLASDGFQVIACDLSKVAIEQNQSQYADISNLDFIVADCMELQAHFDANSFDVIMDKCFIDSVIFRSRKQKSTTLNLIFDGIEHILTSDGIILMLSCSPNSYKSLKFRFDAERLHMFDTTTGTVIGVDRPVQLSRARLRTATIHDSFEGDISSEPLLEYAQVNAFRAVVKPRTFINEDGLLYRLDNDFSVVTEEPIPNHCNFSVKGVLNSRSGKPKHIRFHMRIETEERPIPLWFFPETSLSDWDFVCNIKTGIMVEVIGVPCMFKKHEMALMGLTIRELSDS